MTNKKEEKRVFTAEGIEYAVVRPTNAQSISADEVRRKTFNEELSGGSLLREQLDEELRKRKLWSDDRQMRYDTLRKEILNSEYQLKKGGISLSNAKDMALQMRKNRDEMVLMLSSRTDLDSNTCEGKADSARFNFLFASCLVYNDSGEPIFPKGVEDYVSHLNHPAVGEGATQFYYLMSETEGVDQKLPENKFLKKFNFTNDKYQLVDDDGRLIDDDGRHIDDEGNYVEWISKTKSVSVDFQGRKLDKDGDYIIDDAEPFLDDNGKPIDESKFLEVKSKKKPTKKIVKKQKEESDEQELQSSDTE